MMMRLALCGNDRIDGKDEGNARVAVSRRTLCRTLRTRAIASMARIRIFQTRYAT